MESIVTLCSEGLSIDRNTNNISVYNILERYNARSFPFLVQKIFFYTFLRKDGNTEATRISLVLKCFNNETELFSIPVSADFTQSEVTRIVSEIGGVVIKTPGLLKFVLVDNDKTISSYEITLVQLGDDKVRQQIQ